MSTLVVRGPSSISGLLRVPGDKSISHRALLLASVAKGASRITNLATGQDVESTARCLRAYGVEIDQSNGAATVKGMGMRSWSEPGTALDCGNSGTTMRTLAGFAAHYDFRSVFDGDESLRRRPMDRVARPLQALGAKVEVEGGRFPPLRITGGRLAGTSIDTQVASAQVKSCVLFAGLGAEGRTVVTEPLRTRDHTERLLEALGAPITEQILDGDAHLVEIEPFEPPAFELDVPGDVSSAAFLIGAALLCGDVTIEGVGLNPTRAGFVQKLRLMRGDVNIEQQEAQLGESSGRIQAARSALVAIQVVGEDVPAVADELPLLGVLATQAEGETIVTGAGELRVKESDRIDALVIGLRKLGAEIHELEDGFVVRGGRQLRGTDVDSAGDHRIAMALAVAGLVAEGETRVEGWESAAVSWPGFERVLRDLGADVEHFT
jgi:3-phosphoshikimate 1-carboxyvinyltransferase